MPNEDKIAGIKEKVSEAICEAEESCEIEREPTESKIESFEEPSQGTVEDDSMDIPIIKVQDGIAVNETFNELVHDIIEDEKTETRGSDKSPSAC